MKRTIVFCLLSLIAHSGNAQGNNRFRVRTLAFYNVENLFDTTNDTLIFDDDRSPEGKDRWTAERYRRKIGKIARVISETGRPNSSSSPDAVGLCEVENFGVLQDLVAHPSLVEEDYGIIHYDSPDERGIDVALLYRKAVFHPTAFRSHRLLLTDEDGTRDYTRDQLVVSGLLEDNLLYLIVNHWPSRSGGESRSRAHRIAAALLNRKLIDSIIDQDSTARVISMGDFNDNPIDYSLKRILKTKGRRDSLVSGDLYNPMESMYRQGMGSLAYRDDWSLFDQFFFTGNLIHNGTGNYFFWKAGIYNPRHLITQSGRFRGYPYRTYAGGQYQGGYSDHFPVYIHLIREVP